jgi:TonB family protein
MGYQALLFCPDEKTARTVTQVLSELDFTVIPCTEPFAAVKKLMGEHFDAIVVDCDNEQNATLLFKSAHNTPSNQSSLAVAVVEGQAGVAKAFRIGANLVLTKPINVEQAKGTLRVARGLLRKNEAGKPAAPAASSGVKPSMPAPAPQRPASQPPTPAIANVRPAPPAAPQARAATASIPAQKPATQPRVVAAASSEITESDAEILDVSEEIPATQVEKSSAQEATPKITSASSSFGTGFGAASAPAPARESKPDVSTTENFETVAATPESPEKETSSPAASFTFGGNVSSGAKSGGGSKKALIAVAAVVLVAAGGYEAWTKWGSSNETTDVPAQVVQPVAKKPLTAPAAVPQAVPTTVPAANSSAVSSAPSSADSAASDSADPRLNGSENSDSDAGVQKTPSHPNKSTAKPDSGKPSASAADKAPAAKTAAPPIVIKNGGSQPTEKAAATDTPAPSITGLAVADNNGALPNLMGSQGQAPTPVLQTMNVSQGVSQGLVLKRTQPVYPPNALHLRIEGPVQLLATISKSGDISAVKVLSGDSSLARAAVEAVKQWKYKPYLLNGEPVEIQTQVTVNFKLPN